MAKKKVSVNTVEAKNRLNELIAEVNRTHEPLIVEKRGKPVAVVLDFESYSSKASAENQEDQKSRTDTFLKELRAYHQMMREKYPHGTGDSVEILREIRREREER